MTGGVHAVAELCELARYSPVRGRRPPQPPPRSSSLGRPAIPVRQWRSVV